MKQILSLVGCFMAFAVQSASDPLCGRVEGAGATPPEGYSPPLISNGDLNMLVEWTGARGQPSKAGRTMRSVCRMARAAGLRNGS